MPEQSVIVWDLETLPDLAATARMLDLGAAPEADVRRALGSGFPKHPLHKIVALIASRQAEGWRIDALGAPYIGEQSAGPLALIDRRMILSMSMLAIFVGESGRRSTFGSRRRGM
jgi:hypothetical protein